MRSAAQRIAAYDARMQSSQIDPTLTAQNALQMANYAGYVATWYPLQMTLRGWLDAEGFSGNVAFMYESLAAECFSVYRRFSGPAAVAEGVILKAKYVALGLVALDVSAMQLAVFGWIIP